MRKLFLILPILMLGVGCNSVRKLTGQDEHHDSAAPKPAWIAITGTWSGYYKTDKMAAPIAVTVWINPMDLYDNNFVGVMNDGASAGTGAIDGDQTSNFTGVVDAVNNKFKLHVVSKDSTCAGTFDLSGDILVGNDGPTDLRLTGVSGSNCKGAATSITGDL